jgi:hypothetical protein
LKIIEKVYPFSYVDHNPQKGKFQYKFYTFEDGEMKLEERPKLIAQNGWIGFMTIWCTPMTRCGKWTVQYRRPNQRETKIDINQWKNLVEVQPGQDVLAGLCMAYIFDVCQRQPFVTLMGKQDPEYDEAEAPEEDDFDSRENEPLTDGGEGDSEDPERFHDEGSESNPDGGDNPPPKQKKKRKKKQKPGMYPPAEPDEEAFADCLD